MNPKNTHSVPCLKKKALKCIDMIPQISPIM